MACRLSDSDVRRLVRSLPVSFNTLQFIEICPHAGPDRDAWACEAIRGGQGRRTCGRRLSTFAQRHPGGIRKVGSGSPAEWARGEDQSEPDGEQSESSTATSEGVPPPGRFGAEARNRQARFRQTSATISECGRNPSDDKGRRHGYLLTLGHEDQNLFPTTRGEDGARKFFCERGIKWWRDTKHTGDSPGVHGPTRNMASSQVACLNFLLPLAQNPSALTNMLSVLDDDVANVVELQREEVNS